MNERVYLGRYAQVGDYIVWLDDDEYVTSAYDIRSPMRKLKPVNKYGEDVHIKKENLRNGMSRGKYFLE